MFNHTTEGLPLISRTLLIGESCIPADRQLVFMLITVYEIVHDTLYNQALARGSCINQTWSHQPCDKTRLMFVFAALTLPCWGKQICSERHPDWRTPDQFYFIQPMQSNILLAINYLPVEQVLLSPKGQYAQIWCLAGVRLVCKHLSSWQCGNHQGPN